MLSRILKIAGSAVLAVALSIPGGAHAAPATGATEKAPAARMGAKAASIPAVIVGSITYRERIALPPGSHATVQLLDTSRADAPAVVVAEQRIAVTGQVPIPFSLDYDAAGLEPKNTYVVSARIAHGDQLLFISDTATPVITRGNPLEADLVLKKVSAKQ